MTSSNNVTNLLLIAQFELKKAFSGTRGLIGLGAFILCWLVLLIYPISSAANWLSQPGFVDMVLAITEGQANKILSWPVPELAMFWLFALYLFPFSVLMVSADMFATDRQHGTLRFILQRASRMQILLGRILGHFILQLVLITIAILATLLMAALRQTSMILEGLNQSLLVASSLMINVLPFLAMMAVLSMLCRSSRMSILWAVIILLLGRLIIELLIYNLPFLSFLSATIPGSQLSHMLNTQGIAVLSFSYVPILQFILLLAIGATIFRSKRL